METESATFLRADVAAMRGDLARVGQDHGVLDARVDALENWRERYLAQEDQIFAKLFLKVDDLTTALSELRAELSRMRGERDAERRVTITIVSLLSALCGGLATNFLHVAGH
jgi:ribosomal 50S subunit-associated protein YjgA (DUF615 family)